MVRLRGAWVVLLLGAPWCAAGENLIVNGDLETPAGGDAGRPLGWTPHPHEKCTAAWATTGARSGRRCLEMIFDPKEKWGHGYWTSDPIRVKPCMAYRVAFCFRAEGHGVPVFALQKVKEWRLSAGGTEGQWVGHRDVVVIPADVTQTVFQVSNYNRPGKSLWVDDIELVELPLSESPLTQRLESARRTVAALDRNLRRFELTPEQRDDLAALRRSLTDAGKAYGKLEAGAAGAADFATLHGALGDIEQRIGSYLFTLWPIAEEDRTGGGRRPGEVRRAAEVRAVRVGDGTLRCRIGLMALVHEGLPVRVTLQKDNASRKWQGRLSTLPSGAPGQGRWGELNSLGELFLPPGVARFVEVEIQPVEAKAGHYALWLSIECLDRVCEPGRVDIHVDLAPGR